jgi:hypothetical protein
MEAKKGPKVVLAVDAKTTRLRLCVHATDDGDGDGSGFDIALRLGESPLGALTGLPGQKSRSFLEAHFAFFRLWSADDRAL